MNQFQKIPMFDRILFVVAVLTIALVVRSWI